MARNENARFGYNPPRGTTYHHMPNQNVVVKGRQRAVCGDPVRAVSADGWKGRKECAKCRKERGF